MEKIILTKYKESFVYITISILVLLFAYFCWLASALTVHFSDSYEFLNNAKTLLGLASFYDYTHPPVFSMLLVPAMFLYRISGNLIFLERIPYFYMLLIHIGVFYCFWKLLRIELKTEVSLLILGLFLLNRVIFHYIPFPMADLFAMGLVVAMILSWYQLIKTERYIYVIFAGCFLGLAGATKHYLVILGSAPFFFILTEWIIWNGKSIKLKPHLKHLIWFTTTSLIGMSLFFLAHKIVFYLSPEFHNQPFFELFVRNMNDLKHIGGIDNKINIKVNILFNINTIIKAFPLPILLLSAIGFVLTVMTKDLLGRLLTTFFIVHMIIMLFIVSYPETRYLSPIFPIIYYFVGFAIKWVIDYLPTANPLTQQRLSITSNILILVAIVSTLYNVNIEMKCFSEECHYDDVLIRLSHYVREKTTSSNRVLWVGPYFTLTPKKRTLIEVYAGRVEDYYLYESVSNSIAYYSDRPCYNFYPYYYLPVFIGDPKEGDLIVINPENSSELRVYRFHQFWQLQQPKIENNTATFTEPNNQLKLVVSDIDGGLQLQGQIPPALLWSLTMQNQKEVFTNALPIFQYPTKVMPNDKSLSIKEIQKFSFIPLNQLEDTFYPRPTSINTPTQP